TECGHPISIVHWSSELLSSNHPPASASMKLGLQAPYRYRTECGHPISIVHCSSELLSSNHPPASASMKLGLQARATTPGGRSAHKSAV
uniref:Uncharacterized protein n=1 Tax=Oryzias latipes TaxID=8090 RepID=A0A3B3I401_ORYLA